MIPTLLDFMVLVSYGNTPFIKLLTAKNFWLEANMFTLPISWRQICLHTNWLVNFS